MKQKNITILLVPILILVIAWVIFNVYHSYITSTIQLPLANDIVPIEGSFDTKTIKEIRARTRISPLNEVVLQVSGTPTPTPTPELSKKTASTSAEEQ